MNVQTVIAGWRTAPRSLFVLDGVGALVSASTLGALLPLFATELGTTRDALWTLAALPLLYAIYDLVCVWKPERRTRTGLLAIAAANAAYPAVTALVLSRDDVPLTGLGIAYFTIESAIVFSLAAVECHVARGMTAR